MPLETGIENVFTYCGCRIQNAPLLGYVCSDVFVGVLYAEYRMV